MARLAGDLRLDHTILVDPECLDSSFPICVAGIRGTVRTPRLPKWFKQKRDLWQLREPHGWDHPWDVAWGMPVVWPSGLSYLSAMHAKFRYRRGRGPIRERAAEVTREIVDGLSTWLDRFYDAVEVLTGQVLNPGPIGRPQPGLMVEGWDEKGVRFFPSRRIHLYGGTARESERLQKESFSEAIARANSSDVPHLAHLLLRDARHALSHGDGRRAAIDSGSAAEVVLTEALERSITRIAGEERAKRLLGRFRTLGARVELAWVYGLLTDERKLKKEMVAARNEAAHEGAAIEREKARRAYKLARGLVSDFIPDPFAD